MLTLEERTDTEAATVLGLAADDPLIFLERVRLLDDEPIAVDCSWLPASFAHPLLEVDFARTSLYGGLRSRCGVSPSTAGSASSRSSPPMSSESCWESVPTWSCSRSSGSRATTDGHSVDVTAWSAAIGTPSSPDGRGTGVATGMEPADG